MENMPKTHLTLQLEANSHSELRDQVRRVAEDMGLLSGRSTPAVHTPEPDAEPAETQTKYERDTQGERDTGDDEPLVWYHKPDSQEVWQEPEQKRRKGIVKVDEGTAARLIADYDAAKGDGEDDAPGEDTSSKGEESGSTTSAGEDDEPGDWEDDTPEEGEDVTLDDVKKAVGAFAQENGNKAGKDLVASFGVAKLSELEPEQYAAVVKKAGGLR